MTSEEVFPLRHANQARVRRAHITLHVRHHVLASARSSHWRAGSGPRIRTRGSGLGLGSTASATICTGWPCAVSTSTRNAPAPASTIRCSTTSATRCRCGSSNTSAADGGPFPGCCHGDAAAARCHSTVVNDTCSSDDFCPLNGDVRSYSTSWARLRAAGRDFIPTRRTPVVNNRLHLRDARRASHHLTRHAAIVVGLYRYDAFPHQ